MRGNINYLIQGFNPESTFFYKKTWKQKVFFFQFETIMSSLALPDSFEYLCYGSTAIRNIFTLTVQGSTLVN